MIDGNIKKNKPFVTWGFFSLKIILCEFLFFLVVQVYMVNDGEMWSFIHMLLQSKLFEY